MLHPLQKLHATLRALHWLYWTFHWQAQGNYADHLLFERLYKDVEPEIDNVAEKVVAMLGVSAVEPVDSAQETKACLSTWVEDIEGTLSQKAHHANRQLLSLVESMEGETRGLDNLLDEIAGAHEVHEYLLGQQNGVQKKMAARKLATRVASLYAAGKKGLSAPLNTVNRKAAVVSPDHYLLTESGEYVWSVPRVQAAWASANAKLKGLLANGNYDQLVLMVGVPASGKSHWLKSHQVPSAIYFDATFTSAKIRKLYIDMAKEAGMKVVAVFMQTPLKVCLDRNSCRTVDRRVPEDTMTNMSITLAGDPPTMAEGFDDIILVNSPQARTARNQKVIEAPHHFSEVKVQPPKKKREEYPFEGFIDFQGLKIDVENAKGSVREGTTDDGKKWRTEMLSHYGEIRGAVGVDSDGLDAYIGDNHDSPVVVVIHQHNPWDGKYDEDKVMLGYDSVEEAIGAYKKQYDKPGFFRDGEFLAMPIGQFWRWVCDRKNRGKRVVSASRKTAAPLADIPEALQVFEAHLGTLHQSVGAARQVQQHVEENLLGQQGKITSAYAQLSADIKAGNSNLWEDMLDKWENKELGARLSLHTQALSLGGITESHFRSLQGTAEPLFLALLQQYALLPNLTKKIQAALRYWTKSKIVLPSKKEPWATSFRGLMYPSFFLEQYQIWQEHLALVQQCLSAGGQHGTETVLQAGPFRVVNTGNFPKEVMGKVADLVVAAAHAMTRIGLHKLCYGDILISNSLTGRALAFYIWGKDELFVRANVPLNEEVVRVVCHELAHRLEKKFMAGNGDEILTLYKEIKSSGLAFVSPYAKTDPSENFAEMVSYEAMGQLPAHLRPLLDNLLTSGRGQKHASRMSSNEDSFKPPAGVAAQAKRGLEYRQKQTDKAGLTPAEASKEGIGSGVQRATNLKNRDNISLTVIKQMSAFFSRHAKNKSIDAKFKDEPWKDKGYVSWLLWGGDAGKAWVDGILAKQDD